jgi:hypothetical protein
MRQAYDDVLERARDLCGPPKLVRELRRYSAGDERCVIVWSGRLGEADVASFADEEQALRYLAFYLETPLSFRLYDISGGGRAVKLTPSGSPY